MLRKLIALLVGLAFLLGTCPALAQAQASSPTQNSAGDPWARLRLLVGEEKVDVTTKSGLKVRGILVRFEWEEVTLRDNKMKDHVLKREEVAEIRTLPNRSALARPMVVGAALGGVTGLVGGAVSAMEQPKSVGQRRVGIGAGIGIGVGALVGYLVGKSDVKPARVVYTAQPPSKEEGATRP